MATSPFLLETALYIILNPAIHLMIALSDGVLFLFQLCFHLPENNRELENLKQKKVTDMHVF